jgi:hypothetical protein
MNVPIDPFDGNLPEPWPATCQLCGHEWRRHDPEDGKCDAPHLTEAGVCWCGRDADQWRAMNAAASRAALAESHAD